MFVLVQIVLLTLSISECLARVIPRGDDASLLAASDPPVYHVPSDDFLLSGAPESRLSAPAGGVNNVSDGSNGSGAQLVHTRVFQQSVTLTASMWPVDGGANGTSGAAGSPWGLLWRVSSERLPLLVGVFCGGALVVFVLLTLIIYRCCIMPRREKHYCMRKVDPEAHIPPAQPAPGLYPSHSAVFADPKSGQLTYSSRLVMTPAPAPLNSASVPSVSGAGRQHWFYNNRIVGAGLQCTQCPGTCPVVPRSSSNPGPAGVHQVWEKNSNTATINTVQRRQRPVSQPIRFGPCDLVTNGETPKKIPMPEISEFSPQTVQYASSSILDEVGIKDEDGGDSSGATNLKTRSLPAWVRSKPRPLSTEDDLADLYAKVNFSKKRKNRMRNDEAAIIALSKSRSQFLHKDTDSLVDNEAVIVYDERTAL